MLSILRCFSLVIFVSGFIIRASDVRAEPPDQEDFASIRAWVESQPRTFENEVLFAVKDGQIVRSEYFTTAGAIFGDFDGDEDIDLHDYNAFQICLSFSGPGWEVPLPCLVFDSDGDEDVDLRDANAFIEAFTGAVAGIHVEAGELFPATASPFGYYSYSGGTDLNGNARQGGYSQDDFWYEWSVLSKPSASGQVLISNRTLPNTPYMVLAPFPIGDYVFGLKVTNLVTLEFGTDSTTLLVSGCTGAAFCDDGQFCTGAEDCDLNTGFCLDGRSPCEEGEVCEEFDETCHPACGSDANCDDDLFCNGQEYCAYFSAGRGCLTVQPPCDETKLCDEDTDRCIPICFDDGDCDDGDFCNGAELCTDGACAAGADPCPDDGVFCNGTESCDLATDACQSSGDPCAAGETCNEALNICVSDPGVTIRFTLGTDMSPATNGTGGDDTYLAPLLFNAPTGTNFPSLQTGDSANGGDGADVLNAQFNFTGGTTIAPTLTAIETINLTDFGTAATTLSGSAITGATSVNLSNSTNGNVFTVTNLPNIVNLGMTNQAIGATLSFAAAATSGAADATTVSVSGLTGAATTLTLTTGTTNGLETLNLVSSTVASSFSDIAMNGTTLSTVNVSGGADLTITTTLDSNVTTVNASAATGAVTLTQTNAGVFTFTGGAGNDTIILGNTYGTTDTINGGAGTDTLGGTTAVLGGTSTAQTKVTNVESLRVSDAYTTALNVSHFGSITEVVLDAGSNAGSITNAANGIKVSCGARATDPVGAGALTVTLTGSAITDSATFTLNDCDQTGLVTFTGAETLNLVSNLDLDGSAAAGGTAGVNTLTGGLTLTATAALEKVVVTGTESLTITAAVNANEIDASGFGQAFVMGAAMTVSGVTVTGGSGDDTLFGSAGNDIVNGGTGADIINAGDGNDIIIGGTGADTFRFTAGDLSAAPSNTLFDNITDFAKDSDIFDETVGALVIVSGSAAAAGTAAINAEGIATFNAADDTLAERVIATEAGINASGVAAARQFAVFEHSTNSYLFVSDGVDGIGANDMLFQMTGVTGLSDTTLTAGDLTIK